MGSILTIKDTETLTNEDGQTLKNGTISVKGFNPNDTNMRPTFSRPKNAKKD